MPAETARATTTDTRSKVARRRLLIGLVVVLVVVGGVGFLLTRGSSGGGIGQIFGHSAAPATPVHFTVDKVGAEKVAEEVDRSAMQSSLKETGTGVGTVLDQLFSTGYADPSKWGDAGEIKDLFVPDAAQTVEDNVNTLTIGEHADDTYESLQPLDAKVRVRALIDAHGKSIRAYADAKFAGLARHKDGTYSKITVSGSFFLVPAGDGWKIEAFRVNRLERPAKAPASPSSSASASGGSS